MLASGQYGPEIEPKATLPAEAGRVAQIISLAFISISASMLRQSRSSSEYWRSAKRRWGQRIPIWRVLSANWQRSIENRASSTRQKRSINWRLHISCYHLYETILSRREYEQPGWSSRDNAKGISAWANHLARSITSFQISALPQAETKLTKVQGTS